MKQMACEMCGSANLVKQDGVFVCQNCGCKYSIEEAKKMMVEGTVQVEGTINVANVGTVENYLHMAQTAYDANNKGEAEAYCNEVIEIDINNWQAWFLKGKSAGWQSTLTNNRLEEVISCFSKSESNCPEDKYSELKKEILSELFKISFRLVALSCENFEINPIRDNLALINDCAVKCKAIVSMPSRPILEQKECIKEITSRIDSAIESAMNNIIISYEDAKTKITIISGANTKMMNACKEFMDRGLMCIALYECSITLSDENSEVNIDRYEKMIEIYEGILILECEHRDEIIKGYWYWSGTYYLNNKEAIKTIALKCEECFLKIKEINPDYVNNKFKWNEYEKRFKFNTSLIRRKGLNGCSGCLVILLICFLFLLCVGKC